MRLQDKVVLITGAGAGLGRESALLFAREGASLVVTDKITRRAEDAAALIAERGGKAVARTLDVRSEADVEAGVRAAVEEFGRLDVMFANAGIPPKGFGRIPLEDVTAEGWDDVQHVLLRGVFFAIKHATRVMKGQGGGTIVVTSSASSLVAYPGFGSYGAAKGGVNSLVRHASLDLGKYGIRVNALCPTHGMSVNFMLPPEAEVLGLSYEEAAGPWDPAVSPIPLKLDRPPRLADNAAVALFLASDDSAYMSGVCLPAVDGGSLSRVAMYFDDSWQDELPTDELPTGD
ncbi:MULTISPECIES: SDR family NAD(P)-dependent oxidoreductase [unclassified Frankia]|uniref:SDR family NAD(P)-dependent oxidoreductase n=1 Tax=unclassified Frankia TaxID=2632575 RepID=UPI002AD22214|nr:MULTISPECIES: SDR family NAD(P)-dependent oxidoreductase [unclassified Frankia]